jgi:isocitrate dehydrogenase
MYWWKQLLDKDAELKALYPIAQEFKTNEATINTEILMHKVKPQEIGGYYQPNLL